MRVFALSIVTMLAQSAAFSFAFPLSTSRSLSKRQDVFCDNSLESMAGTHINRNSKTDTLENSHNASDEVRLCIKDTSINVLLKALTPVPGISIKNLLSGALGALEFQLLRPNNNAVDLDDFTWRGLNDHALQLHASFPRSLAWTVVNSTISAMETYMASTEKGHATAQITIFDGQSQIAHGELV